MCYSLGTKMYMDLFQSQMYSRRVPSRFELGSGFNVQSANRDKHIKCYSLGTKMYMDLFNFNHKCIPVTSHRDLNSDSRFDLDSRSKVLTITPWDQAYEN